MLKFFFFLFGLIVASNAEALTKTSELKSLTQQIRNTTSIIGEAKNQREHIEQELKNIEVAVGEVAKKLSLFEKQSEQETQKLMGLQSQEQQYVNDLEQQQLRLREQVRAAYLLGERSQLKTLLNQEDPQEINRLLHYHRYINNARLEIILNLNQLIKDLMIIKEQIQLHTTELNQLKQAQEIQKAELEKKLTERQKVVGQLNNSISSKEQKLKELTANQQALQKVVDSLKIHRPTATVSHSFQPTSGKYAWPTKGILLQHFGAEIAPGGLRATHVIISAPSGQSVHAISAGKVVFADWLRGLGLLIIVDHGNGLMSLYGHNKSLFKKVNEQVNAGEAITSVGNSGGIEKTGLYFQLRKNGTPINPEKLCR